MRGDSKCSARASQSVAALEGKEGWEKPQGSTDSALRHGGTECEWLDVEKSLIEVGDDVFYVFDADGEAHQAFGDADAFTDFDGHGCVGHDRGKRDESFDAAEAFGERAKFHLIEEAASGVLGFEIESEHGSRAALLLASDLVMGM